MSDESAREREFWDSAASTLEGARAVVWAEPEVPNAWEARTKECVNEIIGAIEPGLDMSPWPPIMDLGCGVGRLAFPMALAANRRVIGVDASSRMVALAKEESEARADAGRWAAWFMLGDGRTIPETGPLAAAYSVAMFQHIPKDATFGYIRQVAERLISGGRFRFQFVDGSEDTFLSHGLNISEVEETCIGAGLKVLAIDRGIIFPSWVWVTAERVS